MSWVTWRQHRLEAAWALVLGAALLATMAFVTYQLHRASCSGLVNGYCFNTDMAGQAAQVLAQLNLYQYGLVVLPALAGAFIGCPLVARELENGTHRLAWTQGATRLRWLLTKLIFLFLPLMLIAAVAGWLEFVLVSQMGSSPNHWAVFDQHAPMTVAATFFALALGVAVGALMGRSVPAMGVTLVVYCAVRIGIAVLARPNYIAPLAYKTTDLNSYNGNLYPTAWWTDNLSYYDASGRYLGTVGPGGYHGQAAYMLQHFQPADRFWAFQSIESAILSCLSIALVVFAVYWVTRRVS